MGNNPGKATKLSSTTHCQLLHGDGVGKVVSAGEGEGETLPQELSTSLLGASLGIRPEM